MMPQTSNEADKRHLEAQRMSDTGEPVRQCAVTRERHAQSVMIRFVRSPDGFAVPDIAGKLGGRGAWIKPYRGTLEKGLANDVFSRAFQAKTEPMDDLVGTIEDQLARRCTGLIGMAKKGGLAVVGFDQVRASIRKQKPGWILHASDGAKDSRNKVQFLAKAIYDGCETASALTSEELGMAFGRPHVVHALITKSPLAKSFGLAYRRLLGFRQEPVNERSADKRSER